MNSRQLGFETSIHTFTESGLLRRHGAQRAERHDERRRGIRRQPLPDSESQGRKFNFELFGYSTFLIQDLLFDGVRSGVVALIVQLIALFGAVIPNIEDLVPLPIALQA